MASVSSLDQDMRKLRLDRYTPAAATEARTWIESTLREPLDPGDLLDALKDGVALCKLANMVLPPPGIKFKPSSMPFTQRENISHFLSACELPPLSLPAHDRFLTVDLYDNKDPAQVLQCIGAFSRAAHAANPSKFPSVLGPKRQPSPTRNQTATNPSAAIRRPVTPTSYAPASSRSPPTGAPVSSWSRKNDELTSAPAWNIHQYGYMGGASQGNQGISFGSRRQIISPDINVPSLAEKEKLRKEQVAGTQRQRAEAVKAEAERLAQIEAQERLAQEEEQRRWHEETRQARERERQLVEEEKRRWQEEERRWQEEEEQRRSTQAQPHNLAQPSLTGQYLSQSQGQQTQPSTAKDDRIHQLERQLEEARQREQQYERERQQRNPPRDHTPEETAIPSSSPTYRRPPSLSPSRQPATSPTLTTQNAWSTGDRSQLRQAATGPEQDPVAPPVSSTATTSTMPVPASHPLPNPESSSAPAQESSTPSNPSTTPQAFRPLPDPTKSSASPSSLPFARRGVQSSPFARSPAPAKSHFPSEMSLTSTSEQAAEDARRVASQAKTRAGGLASKSLLEREMERERERQREWEQNQMQRAQAQPPSSSDPSRRVMSPR